MEQKLPLNKNVDTFGQRLETRLVGHIWPASVFGSVLTLF